MKTKRYYCSICAEELKILRDGTILTSREKYVCERCGEKIQRVVYQNIPTGMRTDEEAMR